MVNKARKLIRGFTLIELLVAMALVAILSTIVVASFRNGNRSKSVALGIDLTTSALRTAQGASLTGGKIAAFSCTIDGLPSNQASEYRIRFSSGSSTYLLLAYDKCSNPPVTLETYQLAQNVLISSTGLKVTSQSGTTSTAIMSLELRFSPPFGKITASLDGEAFVPFRNSNIQIQSEDGSVIRNLTLDGISGTINSNLVSIGPAFISLVSLKKWK
jgi:prepilin-type N-terminal cleavage/methylation domain-containing protein